MRENQKKKHNFLMSLEYTVMDVRWRNINNFQDTIVSWRFNGKHFALLIQHYAPAERNVIRMFTVKMILRGKTDFSHFSGKLYRIN